MSSLVTGKAMTVLRAGPSGSGWEAGGRIYNRFDPRAPAKSLMTMMEAMSSKKKVEDIRELSHAVEDCQELED